MIRHVVTWTLGADDPHTRAEHAREIAEALRAMPAVVPQIRALSVGVNVIDAAGNADVALVADFDSAAELAAYQEHPEHLALVPLIRSRVAGRSCVDFELAD